MAVPPKADRPVDRFRNSGASLKIGNKEDVIRVMISTGEKMYLATDHFVAEVKLADQIDPDRLNENIPKAVHQHVLKYGMATPFVAKTFLTAGELFNLTYLGNNFPRTAGIEAALEVARRFAALYEELQFIIEHQAYAKSHLEKQVNPRSFRLPEIVDIRDRVEKAINIMDRIALKIVEIGQLFYPKPSHVVNSRESLLQSAEKKSSGDEEYLSALRSILETIKRMREQRNASTHADGVKSLTVVDYQLTPNGVEVPMMEITHPQYPQARTQVAAYISENAAQLLDTAEALIAWMSSRNIVIRSTGFETQLAQMPNEELRDGSRYFYYTTLSEEMMARLGKSQT